MRSWLWERVHGYYFVIAFFGGVIFGIIAGIFVNPLIFSHNFILLISACLLAVSVVKFRRIFLIAVLLSGLFFGTWRSSSEVLAARSYMHYYGKNVSVKGVVSDDTTRGPDGKLRFKLKDVAIENHKMSGEVWASSESDQVINRSDTLETQGFMSEGFGSFTASLTRAKIIRVERTSSQDLGLQARDNFAKETDGLIPEPQRSLGLGYLLGLKTALPENLQQQIMVLGLTHIVVASGYNLTILVAFARRIFQNISKYLSALVGSAMIIGFTMITGFSPSMARAGLVAGLSLLAWYYGRKIHPASLLIVAAAITLIIHPAYIWGDIGWYLSFAAFFGILILAPLLHDYFWGIDHKPSALRELAVATLSAQVLTFPIILHSFGVFSLYSLPANLLVLPVIPLCMMAVFAAGLAGFVLPFAAGIFALPAVWLLKYCTFIIDRLSHLPNARMEMKFSLSYLFASYLILGIMTTFLFLKTKHNFLNDKLIVD